MKQVLLINAPPIFQDFITEKLTAEHIDVEAIGGMRGAFTKVLSLLPDLIIIDNSGDLKDIKEFMSKKRVDPNAAKIPIIICGQKIARARVADLIQYGVIKYFNKPIKFDVFFESISKTLNVRLSLDSTPCVLDVHLNKQIIFIELALGLNRDKISLLKFRLAELIESNELLNVKVIVMLTNLTLGFMDGANIELLFDSIIANRKISRTNIKVLSLSPFVKELITGHLQYKGITVVSNLSEVLNSVIEGDPTGNIHQQINDKILAAPEEAGGAIEMRFHSDSPKSADEEEVGDVIQVAIVDDEKDVREELQRCFSGIGMKCELLASGAEFIARCADKHFDIALLDILMPGMTGFEVLKVLRRMDSNVPVLVYSKATQKEAVIQALSLGAKGYLVKPQPPEVIKQKALEVLHETA